MRPSRYEIEPWDGALHATSKRGFRPEVSLTIRVLHRLGFDQPVDDCEKRCLKEREPEGLGPRLRANGRTALWDAVGFGLDTIGQGKNRKKVLVVVTDGDDNRSRLTFRELLESVRERDVLVYAVGMGGAPKTLSQLAEATGARAHFPRNLKQCREAMRDIGREVSQHYSLGYYPTSTVADGKWRSIRVAVGPPGSGHVVRTRAGYYAPRMPVQPDISTTPIIP